MTESDKVLDILRNKCYDLYNSTKLKNRDGICETVFDGVFCWPNTKAGMLAVQPCSNDLLKSTKKGFASRQCTEKGTWLIPENRTEPWSNLTQCGTYYIELNYTADAPAIYYPEESTICSYLEETPSYSFYWDWLPIIKSTSYVGYTISIISLIIAVCIFIHIKRLHCARNKLHINLFISLIMRLFMAVVKDTSFIRGTALSVDTVYDDVGDPKFMTDHNYSWICKAIISIQYYFIISNFMLMLMEGIYLHNLMFLNLLSDNNSVTIYCFLGWGIPMLFIIPWITTKSVFENVLCWTQKENTYISLLIDLPIGMTVVINFILFIIIVRVLTIKLNNACIQQRRIKYRKFMKATLILIPLFGVPYTFSLLMSFYVTDRPILEMIWLFFDQTFTAFQGLFAALVYCLLNSEVQIEVKRKYLSMKDRNHKEFSRSRTISHTQQFSLQTNENDWGLDKENGEDIMGSMENPCYF